MAAFRGKYSFLREELMSLMSVSCSFRDAPVGVQSSIRDADNLPRIASTTHTARVSQRRLSHGCQRHVCILASRAKSAYNPKQPDSSQSLRRCESLLLYA